MIGKIVILCVLLLAAQGLRVRNENHETNQWNQNKRLAETSKYAWYSFNEWCGSRCQENNDCDGQRYCFYRFCQGVARPPRTPTYQYDEKITGGKCPSSPTDPNYAYREYYCNGTRRCSATGVCENLPPKDQNYNFSEAKGFSRCPLSSDPNYLIKDYFCDGARTCSQFGWCQGKAR